MAGLNLTGKPSPGNYLLGRGSVLLASLLPSGKPDAFRHVGNCPDFNVNVEVEDVEHKTSLQSTRIVDANCILSLKVSLDFTLDEMSYQNMAQFFLGDATSAGYVNPAIAGFVATAVTTAAVPGMWYEIVSPTGLKPKGFVATDVSVVSDSGGAATALVLGTDYELDLEHGYIFLVVGGAAAPGLDITVALAANAGAPPNIHQVHALTQGVQSTAVRFRGISGCNALNTQEFKFHSVTLKPEGQLGLVSDNYSEIGFNGVAAASSVAYPSSPYFTIETAKA